MSPKTITVPDGVVPISEIRVTPSHLATGIIAGIVVGAVTFVAVFGFGAWLIWRRRRWHKMAYRIGNEAAVMVCRFVQIM